MKRIILTMILIQVFVFVGKSQGVLPMKYQSAVPSEYPDGVYLMGSESDAPYSWMHDAGVVLGLKPFHSNFRHTQLIFNANSTQISLRSKNGTEDNWGAWRKIFTGDYRGYLGLGTTSPETMLHINAVERKALNIYRQGNTSKYLSMWQGTNAAVIDPIGSGILYVGGYDVPTTVLMAKSGGKVGIRTSEPLYPLDVNGIVRATEIKVEAQTADFVFEDDYQLKSLEEVEQFVQENKHLPDVPSAKQMEENGVGLAEMNKLLLQKVEELTLYMIEMQKIMKEQNIRINDLENR
jgi:hypothetical protein